MLGFFLNGEAFTLLEVCGMLACFSGVVMMALTGYDPTECPYLLGKTVGVLVMTGVAVNDALIAVMARTMKDVHFSVLMFWFSAIGFLIMSSVIFGSSLWHGSLPTIFGSCRQVPGSRLPKLPAGLPEPGCRRTAPAPPDCPE